MADTILERIFAFSLIVVSSIFIMPFTGFINNIITSIKSALIKLVTKNTKIVLVRILDNLIFFDKEAILLVIVKKTSGTTRVNIKLTNKSPKGLTLDIKLSLANKPNKLPIAKENNQ